MRRVVVTGMGLVSCLGNDKQTVAEALRTGRSGIRFNEEFKAMGLRSHVCGSVDIDLAERIDRKHLRFMGDAAAYAYIAYYAIVHTPAPVRQWLDRAFAGPGRRRPLMGEAS